MIIAVDQLADSASSDHAVIFVGVVSALATILAAWFAYRASKRATNSSEKVQLSDNQLKWTQQAMSEATTAKADALQATAAARTS